MPATVSNPQTCALLLTCTHKHRSTELPGRAAEKTRSLRRLSTSTSSPTCSAKTYFTAQHVVQPQPPRVIVAATAAELPRELRDSFRIKKHI